ncbi:MAG: SH3 domain-containing protein [Thermoflexales bacterium]|nr:SH3 domain-containing protein [Thermoflexales bacterium]
MMKARVTATLLNVRMRPGLDAPIIGLLERGQEIEVLRVEGDWAVVQLQAGSARLRTLQPNQPVTAFVFAAYLDFGTPPPTFKLGLNTLIRGRLAKQEAERGCEFFLCMDDFAAAAEIKRAHPNAVVMARRFFQHGVVPTVEQIIEGLEGATNKDLVYIGLNEADQLGQDGADLRRRAELDIAVARRIKQISGATYAAGTFSVGCPDFTNPETCQIIREIYAPAYNSGLIAFDMHPYSPSPQSVDQPSEWKWFERRWEFLFTRCGFDPRVRAIYFSECGLDNGKGFKGNAYTPERFREWAQKFIAIQQMPLIVDGVAYPSPVVGGAIFQYGGNNDPRWDSYDLTDYVPVLREFYTGRPVARGRSTRSTRAPENETETAQPRKKSTTRRKAAR